ncbi:hypothetical protein G7046_g381 [Stylonectria norvegica]|nr:hypothetical protein G7046_g381 [Stylonectria norvegica]
MKHTIIGRLAFWTILTEYCVAISITPSNDATALANAIFNGVGITVTSATFTGANNAAGTFAQGPFGIGAGGILTTGAAANAAPGGNVHLANNAAGSTYCGSNTNDGAILMVDINVLSGFSGVLINMILASEEACGGVADPIGVFLDGTQYANDVNGNRITAQSSYLKNPASIAAPNSDTSYCISSPPLAFSIPATPGAHSMVFAICDQNDHDYDSGLMINAQGCDTDCPAQIFINYVTTTSTLDPGVAGYTSTIKAIHTTSGTVVIGVTQATTSTTSTTTTTTTTTTTSTTDEATSTTTTDDPTTTTEDSTSMTTTTDDPTTTTTTSDEPTTTTTESSTESTSTTSTTSSTESTSSSTTQSSTESSTTTSTSTSTSTTSSTPFPTFPESSRFLNATTSFQRTSTSTTPVDLPSASLESSELFFSISETPLSSTETPTESVFTSSLTTEAESTASAAPSNLARINGYVYTGCLGSLSGYPSFTELQTDPAMTTERCITLAVGRRYVGLFNRSCYVSDSLTSSGLLAEGRCDNPCPGDPGLFCGGFINPDEKLPVNKRGEASLASRGAPANILLTLYEVAALDPSSTVTTDDVLPSSSEIAPSTSEDISASATDSLSLQTERPETARVFTDPAGRVTVTAYSTATADITTTITTVVYTTIDPANRSYLILTQAQIVLSYIPCHKCENHGIPTVEMTTIQASCSACGSNGEDGITLTLPKAACTEGQDAEYANPSGVPQGGEAQPTALPYATVPGQSALPASVDQMVSTLTHGYASVSPSQQAQGAGETQNAVSLSTKKAVSTISAQDNGAPAQGNGAPTQVKSAAHPTVTPLTSPDTPEVVVSKGSKNYAGWVALAAALLLVGIF